MQRVERLPISTLRILAVLIALVCLSLEADAEESSDKPKEASAVDFRIHLLAGKPRDKDSGDVVFQEDPKSLIVENLRFTKLLVTFSNQGGEALNLNTGKIKKERRGMVVPLTLLIEIERQKGQEWEGVTNGGGVRGYGGIQSGVKDYYETVAPNKTITFTVNPFRYVQEGMAYGGDGYFWALCLVEDDGIPVPGLEGCSVNPGHYRVFATYDASEPTKSLPEPVLKGPLKSNVIEFELADPERNGRVLLLDANTGSESGMHPAKDSENSSDKTKEGARSLTDKSRVQGTVPGIVLLLGLVAIVSQFGDRLILAVGIGIAFVAVLLLGYFKLSFMFKRKRQD